MTSGDTKEQPMETGGKTSKYIKKKFEQPDFFSLVTQPSDNNVVPQNHTLNGQPDCSFDEMDEDDDFKSEATFRHAVHNFSKVTATQLSTPVMVRGLPWKIMIMPREHAKNRSLGFFLQCNGESEVPNWSCSAHAVLRILSQKEGVPPYERKISHLFYPKENDWGYSCFMMWDQVCDPEKGYVKDDSVIFEVYVNADAPHGVQWDSKRHTGYVGLKNQGATCYMNSLLQTLFFTNKLRRVVYQMTTEGDDPAKSVALAMQRVFYELQFSDKPVGTKKLTRSFGWDTFDSFLQHDVQELCRVLLDNLESKMKSTPVEGTIPKLFEGKMKSYIKCKHIPFESKREEPFYDIQLNVASNRSVIETVLDAFQDYVQVETLDGDNKYDAGEHGLQEAEKGVTFLKFPPVLHLQLMRFQYDPVTDQNVKINDRFEFPEKLCLDRFLETPEPTPAQYTLHAVLVHSGDFHGGHYVVFINPRGTGKWCKFDDDVVSRCSKQEAIDNNYGGGEDVPHRHCTNAYMLVYIRDSAIAEVLHPVHESDIPQQLRERLEEERCQEAAKKQEKSEAHLYLTVNIILEDCFEGYQNFDLVEFEASDKLFRKFKVKKTESVNDFINTVAHNYRFTVNQFRLWPFVPRKNGTCRPCSLDQMAKTFDAPIEEISRSEGPLNIFMEHVTRGERELPVIDPNRDILMFLKCYDYKTTSVAYCGHIFINCSKTLREVMPDLCKRANLPLNTELLIFEEVQPGKVDPITRLDEEIQSALDELMDGDILVFQQRPHEHYELATAELFFRELYNKIEMEFVDRNSDGQNSLLLIVNMRWTYDQLAKLLSQKLSHDPYKIQFFRNSPYRDTPAAPVRYAPDMSVKDMLEIRNKQRGARYKIFYQKVPFRVDELENRRVFKIFWMDRKMKLDELTVYPEKTGTVKHLLEEVRKLVTLPDNSTGKLRLVEITQCRINKVLDHTSSLEDLVMTSNVTRQFRAEEVPEDQLSIDPKTEFLLPVAHFQKEHYHTFGTPFLLKIRNGEPFSAVKSRMQKLLDVPDKEFEKFKFALVTGSKCTYMENEGYVINLNDFSTTQRMYAMINTRPWLGLDHMNRSSRRSTSHPTEKAIIIHN